MPRTDDLVVDCVTLVRQPPVFLTVLPGKWLRQRATPSLRIEDPDLGFQRLLREDRARSMANQVLEKHRSFPNAIVLATKSGPRIENGEKLSFPHGAKFFIVDGQHRVGAESFTSFDAPYACVIHFGLDEQAMAKLFLEINDNQRRVPSSLRWDLLRLVRPEGELTSIQASLIVLELSSRDDSPLKDLIDMTGENPRLALTQGSIAPEVRTLISPKKGPLGELEFEEQVTVLIRFLLALRSTDRANWTRGESPFFYNRVMRAALRLLRDILWDTESDPKQLTAEQFYDYTSKINLEQLDVEKIRAIQGSAGITEIYNQLRRDLFGDD